MMQANKYEQILARRAEGISQNLHRALDRHKRLVTEDVTAALVEHVRSTIMYERQQKKNGQQINLIIIIMLTCPYHIKLENIFSKCTP